jgi:steroid delta-isomerase-like uncharacterized protein
VVTSSTEANKAIVRRYYHELWNSWNLDVAGDLIAENMSFRGSLGVAVQGRARFLDYVRFVRKAFPDFHNTIDELIAEGDVVVARLTYRGTHQGELFGIKPTGKRVSYCGAAIFRISDGRIEDGWVLGDVRGLMQQLEADTSSHAP